VFDGLAVVAEGRVAGGQFGEEVELVYLLVEELAEDIGLLQVFDCFLVAAMGVAEQADVGEAGQHFEALLAFEPTIVLLQDLQLGFTVRDVRKVVGEDDPKFGEFEVVAIVVLALLIPFGRKGCFTKNVPLFPTPQRGFLTGRGVLGRTSRTVWS
jgi:hypothetical protein